MVKSPKTFNDNVFVTILNFDFVFGYIRIPVLSVSGPDFKIIIFTKSKNL